MSLLDPRLNAFFTIAKIGTVQGSAKELGITQTGVTQRIRSLEQMLSVTLFIRSRSGMKLTSEGEALFRYCQGATDLEGQTLSAIKGQAHQTNVALVVAGPTSIMTSRIVPACGPLYDKFPFLYLSFRLDDNENRVELLKKGIVQFAVLSPEEVTNEMDSKVLKPEKYVLVCSTKWKNRKLSNILEKERIIDFYETDQTTFRYLKKFGLFESAKKTRLFSNTNETITHLFVEGVGYGTLTLETAHPLIESGKLIVLNQQKVLEDSQALAWYPRPEMPEYFSEIVRCIK